MRSQIALKMSSTLPQMVAASINYADVSDVVMDTLGAIIKKDRQDGRALCQRLIL